jgi:hypothetical protein
VPRTTGSNLTLWWSHSGQTSVLLYMPCRVTEQPSPALCTSAACLHNSAAHHFSTNLKMIHNSGVIVQLIVVPGHLRPRLV